MLLLVIVFVVGLWDFGPYESTVQAQSIWYKGKDINATFDEYSSLNIDPAKSSSSKKGMVRDGSLNMRATENIIDTSNPNVFSQEQISIHTKFNDTLNKLKAETELQRQNYENLIAQIKKDTDELQATLKKLEDSQKKLNESRRCEPEKLGELETKLNYFVANTQFAFFAQRNKSYTKQGPIPFNSTPLNKGNRFNMKSGEFAPNVSGIYHFYFSGLKTKATEAGTSKLIVQIKAVIGSSNHKVLAEGHVNSQDRYGWFPVQMQATVNLTAADRVYVELVEGSLHESGSDAHRLTAFGGFLVE